MAGEKIHLPLKFTRFHIIARPPPAHERCIGEGRILEGGLKIVLFQIQCIQDALIPLSGIFVINAECIAEIGPQMEGKTVFAYFTAHITQIGIPGCVIGIVANTELADIHRAGTALAPGCKKVHVMGNRGFLHGASSPGSS